MAYYHLYLMDSRGRTHSAVSLHCVDDPTAFAWAPYELQMTAVLPVIEIWHGARSVGRLSLPGLPATDDAEPDFDLPPDTYH